jgi:hypothetical protein
LAPPSDHRCDIEPAHLYVRRRQHAEHVDPAAVDAGLLSSLAERGLGKIMIIRVSGTARESNLSRVGTHAVGALNEHDLRTFRAITDQDQHRCRPGSDSWPDGNHLVEPGLLRKSITQIVEPRRSLALGIDHGVTPRYFCARSRISLAELNGPA